VDRTGTGSAGVAGGFGNTDYLSLGRRGTAGSGVEENLNHMEKTASHCGERSFYAELLHMSYILSQKPQYIVKTGYYGLDNTIYCGVYYWREGMRFGKGRREAVPLNTGSSQKAGEDRSEM